MSDVIFTLDDTDALDFEIEGPTPTRVYLAEDRGPKGAPGALTPSTLADRPPASSVPAGTVHYATDSSSPLAVSTGAAWVVAPIDAPFVTSVTDATSSLTTTISALNTYYRIGGLETEDVTWPGGIARVSLTGLLEKGGGAHVLGSADSVSVQQSTDSGTSWTTPGVTVGFRQNVANSAWLPEVPIGAVIPDIAVGTTVRWRVIVGRIFVGTVPVTAQWSDMKRTLLVEALR